MNVDTALPPVVDSLDTDLTYYGSAVTRADRLLWIVIALAACVLLLVVQIVRTTRMALNQKALVVRVHQEGRPEPVTVANSKYTPNDNEVRYFLTRFAEGFYSRNHRMTPRDYPNSLYFLSEKRLGQVSEQDRKSQWLPKMISGQAASDDDVDVSVKNVSPDYSSTPFYRARIDFEKVFTTASGGESKRETWSATVGFVVDETMVGKHPDYVPFNPLGFQITDLTADQAFK